MPERQVPVCPASSTAYVPFGGPTSPVCAFTRCLRLISSRPCEQVIASCRLPHHSRAHIQRMVLPPAFERLCPLLFIVAYKPTRKLLNLDPLISHLTNSNGCGIIQHKVPLKVSPFILPFPCNPMCIRKGRVVFPRYPLLTTHQPLSSPFVFITLRMLFPPARISGPIATHSLPSVSSVPPWQIPSFHQLADSLSLPKKSTPLQSSKSSLFCQNTRGMGGEGHDLPRTLDDRGDAEDDMRRMSIRARVRFRLFSQTKNLELRANNRQPLRSTQT